MHILATGYTPRGVGSNRLVYSIMSNLAVIDKSLRTAGHTVDRRIVDVDEQGLANNYDIALISIAVPQSLSSRFQFGAMWAMEQFGPERVRFVVDDFLLHQFASQLESGLREPEKRYYSLPQRHCCEAAKQHTDLWVKWNTYLRRSKYKLLLPCFPWARPRLLLPRLENIEPVIFDPTPLALVDPEVLCGSITPVNLAPVPPAERERAWTLAAMRDVGPWFTSQAFSWPVTQYGNKRQGQPIVTERELLDVYCKRWGILGAPYPTVTAGGGWRVRYVHAAVTHSILFLDPQEARTAGKPYDLYRSIVEGASTDQLTDIAERQRAHLLANTWSLDQLTTALNDYVRMS